MPPLGTPGVNPHATVQSALSSQFVTSQPVLGQVTVQAPPPQSTLQLSALLHSTSQSPAPEQVTSTVPPLTCVSQLGAPLQSTLHGSPPLHWVLQSALPEQVMSQASEEHTQSSALHTDAPAPVPSVSPAPEPLPPEQPNQSATGIHRNA